MRWFRSDQLRNVRTDEAMTDSPFDHAQHEAARLSLLTLEPGVEYTLVVNNDSSDHGKAECFFAAEADAERYVNRLKAAFKAGELGEHFHPAPGSLDITVYTVTRFGDYR